MISVDETKFKNPPLSHQLTGINFLVNREYGALFDEQGTGKSYQIVNAACLLYEAGVIDTVVVIVPASVRPTWTDIEFGEIKTHGWVPGLISEFSSRSTHLLTPQQVRDKNRLYWIVTNYEFLRQDARYKQFVDGIKGRNVMMVADEGSFIKSDRAAQTKAVINAGAYAKRRYILDGTPISNSLLDLYTKMRYLSPRIIPSRNFFVFRHRYARMGGYLGKQIIGYQHQEELEALIKPHVLRRLKTDCLDLPEKLYTIREVALTETTWKMYVEMRDQMITWLSDGSAVQTQHAVVKLLRLAQITSGFVGGVGPTAVELENGELLWDDSAVQAGRANVAREIGREKLDCELALIREGLANDKAYRGLMWMRFRAEQERAAKEIGKDMEVLRIYGGQSKLERERVIRRFTQEAEGSPMMLLGQQQAGGWGLNLQKQCHNVIYSSNDYNLVTRLQSEDRVHRSGQRHPVLYTDVLATGPKGQKTTDHIIYRALRRKFDFAKLTTDQWREMLIDPDLPF